MHWTYDGRFTEVVEGWTFNNVVWHGRFSFRTTVAVLVRTETGLVVAVTIADLGRLRATDLDPNPE